MKTVLLERKTSTSTNREGLYVQYGCGFTAPEEWTNFDSSFTLKWERIPIAGKLVKKNAHRFPANVCVGDIVKGLPIRPASCSGVYASHVLEHLTLNDFHRALDNTRRILRPDGIFRLVVPDLELAAREYIQKIDAGEVMANGFFLEETYLGRKERRQGFAAMIYSALTTSEHSWMWDAPSLAHALQEHGFRGVRRCGFGDCEDPMFAFVEDVRRFNRAIAMEARV